MPTIGPYARSEPSISIEAQAKIRQAYRPAIHLDGLHLPSPAFLSINIVKLDV